MGTYFFPAPYKDELIYSTIARYHIYSGNPGHIHSIEDLFNSRTICSSLEFQGELDMLIKNLPIGSKLTWENIIYHHTLFPYYGAFVREERALKAIEIMRRGNLSKVYNMLGVLSWRKNQSLQFFRHCPECVKEDVANYGETFWHREHQIPGVFVCNKHNSYLLDTNFPIIGANRQMYNGARNIEFKDNTLDLKDDMLIKAKLLTESINILLNREYTFYNPEKSRKVLMNKLISKGLASPYGLIRQTKLQEEVVEFWGEEFLKLLGYQIDIKDPANWLTTLVRGKRRISNPISNILLLRAVNIDIDEFLTPDEDTEDFKTTWKNRLKELVENGESIRTISKEMHTSTKTIKRELELLNIDTKWKYNGGGRHVGLDYTETEEYRMKMKLNKDLWLRLRKENPDKSRYDLKEKEEVIFRWLLKYDKEWLFDNSELNPEQSSSLDELWSSRDVQYIKKVKEAVDEMKEGPIRITISAIGSKLGIKGWLSKGYKNMPMINDYLKDRIETIEEYHIRRIKWAIDEMEREEIDINKSKLIEISGVNNKYIMRMENEVRRILEDKGFHESFYL